MIPLRYVLAICFALCLNSPLFGQEVDIMLDLYAGKVWKHKKALLYDTPTISPGFQLGIYRSIHAGQYWKDKWSQPKVGLAYSFISFGDKNVLGYAHSLFPNAYFHVYDAESIQLVINAGFGISYLTKTYTAKTNTTNNAIGSNINNISKLGLGIRTRYKAIDIKAGFDFIHYSNGGTTSPNSGINVVVGNVSFIKSFATNKEEVYIDNTDSEVTTTNTLNKHGFNIQYQLGITEEDVINGPKYLVHAVSGAYRYRFSKAYSLLLGAEYEYSFGKYYFELNNFEDNATASKRAKRYFGIIAQEFEFVHFSLRTQIGIYSNLPTENKGDPFYIKLIPQYNFPLPNNPVAHALSLGLAMKTHYFKAEYVALSIGLNFN